ncbi:hypothetical protein GOODEAATRI_021399, partial [Goodea atripinnis]
VSSVILVDPSQTGKLPESMFNQPSIGSGRCRITPFPPASRAPDHAHVNSYARTKVCTPQRATVRVAATLVISKASSNRAVSSCLNGHLMENHYSPDHPTPPYLNYPINEHYYTVEGQSFTSPDRSKRLSLELRGISSRCIPLLTAVRLLCIA